MKIQSSRHFLAKLAARRMFRASRLLPLTVALCAALATAPAAQALTGTFNGATDATWATDTNWTSGAHPVTGDTAFFTNTAATVNNRTTIDLGAGQAAAAVTFDSTTAAAYTIGAGAVSSQTLTLDNTGAVTLGLAAASAPTTSQLFNAAIVLGTGAVGTTTITNNATAASLVALTFAGTVTGGTGGTAGIKTLNTAGTGAVNFTNALGAGGSTQLNLVETAAGTTTLSGNVTSALNTLRASNLSGTIVVDGQTVTVAAASNYGASGSNQVGKFILNSGSVAFNGGIFSNANSSTGALFKISGGTFTASTVSMATTGANAADTATTASPSTTGFVVTGGTASITGDLSINGATNAATGLVSGGSLTVGGNTNIGNGASTRFNRLQVSGGAYNPANINLAASTTVADNAALLLTGGTTTATKISFGVANSFAGSTGTVTVNGAAANLFVGSGGLALVSANTYTSTINLTAGTLGAAADWSSSLNMNLNGAAGTSFTVQAADAANVAHNISLTGAIGGAGGITKTGGGTLTLTNANSYSGLTTVNAGTLNINGVFALGGANYAGTTINGGTLQYAAGATGNGTLDITANTAATPVAKNVTIGANGAVIDLNGNAVTYANTIGNNGAGALTIRTTAAGGSLTIGAASTYTGPTAVNGATLTLSATGNINSSSAVSVTNAGALTLLNATALSDTGTLSLDNGTTLNLGAGSGTTETINILYLGGNAQPAGTYSASDLAALDGQIAFSGLETLTVLSSVPEPSTYLGGALLVGAACWNLRRRGSKVA